MKKIGSNRPFKGANVAFDKEFEAVKAALRELIDLHRVEFDELVFEQFEKHGLLAERAEPTAVSLEELSDIDLDPAEVIPSG